MWGTTLAGTHRVLPGRTHHISTRGRQERIRRAGLVSGAGRRGRETCALGARRSVEPRGEGVRRNDAAEVLCPVGEGRYQSPDFGRGSCAGGCPTGRLAEAVP